MKDKGTRSKRYVHFVDVVSLTVSLYICIVHRMHLGYMIYRFGQTKSKTDKG